MVLHFNHSGKDNNVKIEATVAIEKMNATLGEGPASQPQSTLSCWKNFPLLIKKILTPLNLVPKKPCRS